MSVFEMCPECAREYQDPSNRRFHAEPIACPACGPRVWLEEDGRPMDRDPFLKAGKLLRDGKIVAIKGLGGFHLACDARNDDAVRTLRVRKGRISKPFAIMVRDLAQAERVCLLDGAARDLLESRRRPVVIVRKTAADVSDYIAPGNANLGVMLPYTPLHRLLFDQCPPALVMTSGNLSEEPLAFTNASARSKLASLADAFLMHDRDIHVPCDDSVVRPMPDGDLIMVRRARGYVPESIELPIGCEGILGVGAEQKNTYCLAWNKTAVVSQHIGDLDTVQAFDYYTYAIEHFLSLFRLSPSVIAHDLHPGYLSTKYAVERDQSISIGVQHHHAHIAGCMAEHGRIDRCIGIALDGTGYGTDGTVWGGEILLADLANAQRLGHFAQVKMPGGEAAIRDPRRMAAAYLHAAYPESAQRTAQALGIDFSPIEWRFISHQLDTGDKFASYVERGASVRCSIGGRRYLSNAGLRGASRRGTGNSRRRLRKRDLLWQRNRTRRASRARHDRGVPRSRGRSPERGRPAGHIGPVSQLRCPLVGGRLRKA